MPPIIKPTTIISRFILALLGCSVFLIIVGTAVRFYYDYNSELRLLDRRVEEVEQSIVPALENSIWLTDWEMVRVQCEGILRMSEIRRVELVVDGRKIVEIGGQVSTSPSVMHDFPLVRLYKEQEVPLGTLFLYTDQKAIRQQLLDQVSIELGLRLVTILILASILFFLFHRMVGRHLIAMASQLRSLRQDQVGTILVLDKKIVENGMMDEIDQLVFSYNEMQRSLLRSFVELRDANEKLSQENLERIKGEVALRENRTMLRNILDTVPQSIFWKDRQSVYLGCNKVFSRVAGLDDPEQIVGKTDFDLPCFREKAEAYREDDQNVVNSKQGTWHTIDSLQLEEGIRLWIDISKVPLLDSEGEVYGVLGVYDDISQQIRDGEELARLESQLSQAQKMEAIGVLAGGIAHDFNNILAAIMGYAEMAHMEVLPGSQLAQYLDRVLTSAHRAKDLVKQILAFSRQSLAERMPIKIQPLVKESLKMLRASIPTTITIKEDIYPHCGVVLADPTQVYQIVMNLCTNAFHAMEATGGVLAVTVNTTTIESPTAINGQQLSPGEYVVLTVSDTGTGIGPETIGKIFDPYFTTKEVGKGTGMGLSISHGIVIGYGGAMVVESSVGLGSKFHVYFPVVNDKVMEFSDSQETPTGAGERILLVDDEEPLREMGRDLIERLGYTVTARSSLEALDAFNNNPACFDLVITDQTMPGMTGIDLARKMLKIRPDLPIILCTGFSNQVNEESAKAIGIKEFALKPLSRDSIAHLIRKLLDGGVE